MNDRLTKSDWLAHGMRTLARQGANSLKVGPMSAALNVSRGSFYWHFRDIADFRSQVLKSWQQQTTDEVIRETEGENAEPDRLNHLMKRAFGKKSGLEAGIRSWAAEDGDVAAVVASVDARRVAYIAGLLISAGVESAQAMPRATFMYWAYLGQAVVMTPRSSSITASAIEEISGLFEK